MLVNQESIDDGILLESGSMGSSKYSEEEEEGEVPTGNNGNLSRAQSAAHAAGNVNQSDQVVKRTEEEWAVYLCPADADPPRKIDYGGELLETSPDHLKISPLNDHPTDEDVIPSRALARNYGDPTPLHGGTGTTGNRETRSSAMVDRQTSEQPLSNYNIFSEAGTIWGTLGQAPGSPTATRTGTVQRQLPHGPTSQQQQIVIPPVQDPRVLSVEAYENEVLRREEEAGGEEEEETDRHPEAASRPSAVDALVEGLLEDVLSSRAPEADVEDVYEAQEALVSEVPVLPTHRDRVNAQETHRTGREERAFEEEAEEFVEGPEYEEGGRERVEVPEYDMDSSEEEDTERGQGGDESASSEKVKTASSAPPYVTGPVKEVVEGLFGHHATSTVPASEGIWPFDSFAMIAVRDLHDLEVPYQPIPSAGTSPINSPPPREKREDDSDIESEGVVGGDYTTQLDTNRAAAYGISDVCRLRDPLLLEESMDECLKVLKQPEDPLEGQPLKDWFAAGWSEKTLQVNLDYVPHAKENVSGKAEVPAAKFKPLKGVKTIAATGYCAVHALRLQGCPKEPLENTIALAYLPLLSSDRTKHRPRDVYLAYDPTINPPPPRTKERLYHDDDQLFRRKELWCGDQEEKVASHLVPHYRSTRTDSDKCLARASITDPNWELFMTQETRKMAALLCLRNSYENRRLLHALSDTDEVVYHDYRVALQRFMLFSPQLCPRVSYPMLYKRLRSIAAHRGVRCQRSRTPYVISVQKYTAPWAARRVIAAETSEEIMARAAHSNVIHRQYEVLCHKQNLRSLEGRYQNLLLRAVSNVQHFRLAHDRRSGAGFLSARGVGSAYYRVSPKWSAFEVLRIGGHCVAPDRHEGAAPAAWLREVLETFHIVFRRKGLPSNQSRYIEDQTRDNGGVEAFSWNGEADDGMFEPKAEVGVVDGGVIKAQMFHGSDVCGNKFHESLGCPFTHHLYWTVFVALQAAYENRIERFDITDANPYFVHFQTPIPSIGRSSCWRSEHTAYKQLVLKMLQDNSMDEYDAMTSFCLLVKELRPPPESERCFMMLEPIGRRDAYYSKVLPKVRRRISGAEDRYWRFAKRRPCWWSGWTKPVGGVELRFKSGYFALSLDDTEDYAEGLCRTTANNWGVFDHPKRNLRRICVVSRLPRFFHSNGALFETELPIRFETRFGQMRSEPTPLHTLQVVKFYRTWQTRWRTVQDELAAAVGDEFNKIRIDKNQSAIYCNARSRVLSEHLVDKGQLYTVNHSEWFHYLSLPELLRLGSVCNGWRKYIAEYHRVVNFTLTSWRDLYAATYGPVWFKQMLARSVAHFEHVELGPILDVSPFPQRSGESDAILMFWAHAIFVEPPARLKTFVYMPMGYDTRSFTLPLHHTGLIVLNTPRALVRITERNECGEATKLTKAFHLNLNPLKKPPYADQKVELPYFGYGGDFPNHVQAYHHNWYPPYTGGPSTMIIHREGHAQRVSIIRRDAINTVSTCSVLSATELVCRIGFRLRHEEKMLLVSMLAQTTLLSNAQPFVLPDAVRCPSDAMMSVAALALVCLMESKSNAETSAVVHTALEEMRSAGISTTLCAWPNEYLTMMGHVVQMFWDPIMTRHLPPELYSLLLKDKSVFVNSYNFAPGWNELLMKDAEDLLYLDSLPVGTEVLPTVVQHFVDRDAFVSFDGFHFACWPQALQWLRSQGLRPSVKGFKCMKIKSLAIDLRTLPSLMDLLIVLNKVSQSLEYLEVHGDTWYEIPLVSFPKLKSIRSYARMTNFVDYRDCRALESIECYLTWFAENIEALAVAPLPHTFTIRMFTNPPCCTELLEDLPKGAHTHAGLAVTAQDPQLPLRHVHTDLDCCQPYYSRLADPDVINPQILPLLEQACFDTPDRYLVRVRMWNLLESLYDALVRLPVTDIMICGAYLSPAEITRAAMLSVAVENGRHQEFGHPDMVRPETMKIIPLATPCVTGIHARMINDIALGAVEPGIMARYKALNARNTHLFRTWEECRGQNLHVQLGHWYGLVKHLKARFPSGIQAFHCAKLATVPVNCTWFNLAALHRTFNQWFMNGSIVGLPITSFGSAPHHGPVVSNYAYLGHYIAFNTFRSNRDVWRQMIMDPHTCVKSQSAPIPPLTKSLQLLDDYNLVKQVVLLNPSGRPDAPILPPSTLTNLVRQRVPWARRNLPDGPREGHRFHFIPPYKLTKTFNVIDSCYFSAGIMNAARVLVHKIPVNYAGTIGMYAGYETAPASYWAALNTVMFGVIPEYANAIYDILARTERQVCHRGLWQDYNVRAPLPILRLLNAIKGVEIVRRLCGEKVPIEIGERMVQEGLRIPAERAEWDIHSGPQTERFVPSQADCRCIPTRDWYPASEAVLCRQMDPYWEISDPEAYGDDLVPRSDGPNFLGLGRGQSRAWKNADFYRNFIYCLTAKELMTAVNEEDHWMRYFGGNLAFCVSVYRPPRIRLLFNEHITEYRDRCDTRQLHAPQQWLPPFGQYDCILGAWEAARLQSVCQAPDEDVFAVTERLAASYKTIDKQSRYVLDRTVVIGQIAFKKVRRACLVGWHERARKAPPCPPTARGPDPTPEQAEYLRGLIPRSSAVSATGSRAHRFNSLMCVESGFLETVKVGEYLKATPFEPVRTHMMHADYDLRASSRPLSSFLTSTEAELRNLPAIPLQNRLRLVDAKDGTYTTLQPFQAQPDGSSVWYDVQAYSQVVDEQQRQDLKEHIAKGRKALARQQEDSEVFLSPRCVEESRLIESSSAACWQDVLSNDDYIDEAAVPLEPQEIPGYILPQATLRRPRGSERRELEDLLPAPQFQEPICWLHTVPGFTHHLPKLLEELLPITSWVECLQIGSVSYLALKFLECLRRHRPTNDRVISEMAKMERVSRAWLTARQAMRKRLECEIEPMEMVRAAFYPEGRYDHRFMNYWMRMHPTTWLAGVVNHAKESARLGRYLYWIPPMVRNEHPFEPRLDKLNAVPHPDKPEYTRQLHEPHKRGGQVRLLGTTNIDIKKEPWRAMEPGDYLAAVRGTKLPSRVEDCFKRMSDDCFQKVVDLHRLRHLNVIGVLPVEDYFVTHELKWVEERGWRHPRSGLHFHSMELRFERKPHPDSMVDFYDVPHPYEEKDEETKKKEEEAKKRRMEQEEKRRMEEGEDVKRSRAEMDDGEKLRRQQVIQKIRLRNNDDSIVVRELTKETVFDCHRRDRRMFELAFSTPSSVPSELREAREVPCHAENELISAVCTQAGVYSKEIEWFVDCLFTQVYDPRRLDEIVGESKRKEELIASSSDVPTLLRLIRDHNERDFALKFNRIFPFEIQHEWEQETNAAAPAYCNTPWTLPQLRW